MTTASRVWTLACAVAVLASAANAASVPSLRGGNTVAATALVEGGAWAFAGADPIKDATITILEKPGVVIKTNDDGEFQYTATVGDTLTFVLAAKDYQTTQYSTLTVPAEGLTSRLTRVYFQVPRQVTYDLLSLVRLLAGVGELRTSSWCLLPLLCVSMQVVTMFRRSDTDAPHPCTAHA